ncbi:CHASE sensor domain-containing protein [Sphingomonas paeninsulae]|nr:CHASE sensor domain-containing protein [Sphingomonas paeninsulae]
MLTRVHLRVTLFAVGMAGLSVLLVGFATMTAFAGENLSLIAKTASYSVAPALVFNDAAAAQEALQPLAATPGVGLIVVEDSSLRNFVSVSSPRDQSWMVAPWIQAQIVPGTRTETIMREGQRIGSVRVTGDASVIGRYLIAG